MVQTIVLHTTCRAAAAEGAAAVVAKLPKCSPWQRSSVGAACSGKNVVQRTWQLAAAAAAVTAAAAVGEEQRSSGMSSLQWQEQPPAAVKSVQIVYVK